MDSWLPLHALSFPRLELLCYRLQSWRPSMPLPSSFAPASVKTSRVQWSSLNLITIHIAKRLVKERRRRSRIFSIEHIIRQSKTFCNGFLLLENFDWTPPQALNTTIKRLKTHQNWRFSTDLRKLETGLCKRLTHDIVKRTVCVLPAQRPNMGIGDLLSGQFTLDCGLRPFQALGVFCMLEATGINRLRNRAAHTCCWEATGPRTVHQEFYLEEQLRMKNY